MIILRLKLVLLLSVYFSTADTVGKAHVTSKINNDSAQFKCPDEPWQCDSEPACTMVRWFNKFSLH